MRSSWTEETASPSAARGAAASFPAVELREPIITWYAWSLASWVATARPMPWLAPDMRAIVFLMDVIFLVCC